MLTKIFNFLVQGLIALSCCFALLLGFSANALAAPTYTITVESNEDWSGVIGGGFDSHSVEGSGSQSFKVTGFPATAVIQKQFNSSGCLKVTITKKGKASKTEETCSEYGVVSVTHA